MPWSAWIFQAKHNLPYHWTTEPMSLLPAKLQDAQCLSSPRSSQPSTRTAAQTNACTAQLVSWSWTVHRWNPESPPQASHRGHLLLHLLHQQWLPRGHHNLHTPNRQDEFPGQLQGIRYTLCKCTCKWICIVYVYKYIYIYILCIYIYI